MEAQLVDAFLARSIKAGYVGDACALRPLCLNQLSPTLAPAACGS
jgi:hypothetical protein